MTSPSDGNLPDGNLVQYAKDAASDRTWLLAANIKLAKMEDEAMRILRDLTAEFEVMCDQFQKKPNRSKAYREAKELLK
jgi:hypothetical protein